MNIVDPDGSITNKRCNDFVLNRGTQFQRNELIKFNDAAILYDISCRGRIYNALSESDGADFGSMPLLPPGAVSRTIKNTFTKDLCWQWQKEQIFASKTPHSPMYYNGFALVNSTGKIPVLMDPALAQIPGFVQLPEDQQRSMLAERMDEMGESRFGTPGTLIHSMGSAIKFVMQLPGADPSILPPNLLEDLSWSAGTTKNETVVINKLLEAHSTLQKRWEETGQGLSPSLLTTLHLMQSRGEMPSPTTSKVYLHEYLGTAWNATFGERPVHFDVKKPEFEAEISNSLKDDKLSPLGRGQVIYPGPKFKSLMAAKEEEYRTELKKHLWVQAQVRDGLRKENKELTEENMRERTDKIVSHFMPKDKREALIDDLEGYIYRLPLGIPYTPFTVGNVYGIVKGLATRNDDLVLSCFPGTSLAYYLEMYRHTGDSEYILALVPIAGSVDDAVKSWKAGNFGHAILSSYAARSEAKQILKLPRRIHQGHERHQLHLNINKETLKQFPQLKGGQMHKLDGMVSVLAGLDPSKVKSEAGKPDAYDLTRAKGTRNPFATSAGLPMDNMPFERDGKIYVKIGNQDTPVIWDQEAWHYRIDNANSDSHIGIINGKWGVCRALRGGLFSSCFPRTPKFRAIFEGANEINTQKGGEKFTLDDIKSKDIQVPDVLYRATKYVDGQTPSILVYGIRRNTEHNRRNPPNTRNTGETQDQIIANFIKHVAGQEGNSAREGSKGKSVPLLNDKASVQGIFFERDTALVTINAATEREKFRSLRSIITDEVLINRLLDDNLISPVDVRRVFTEDLFKNPSDHEFLYLEGDIPPKFIESVAIYDGVNNNKLKIGSTLYRNPHLADGDGTAIVPFLRAAEELSRPGGWNALGHAAAAQATAQCLRLSIKIHNPDNSIMVVGSNSNDPGVVIEIYYLGMNKYEAKVDDDGTRLSGGDDGFFGAVSLGLHYKKDVPDDIARLVAHLRQEVSQEMINHPERYTKAYVEFLHPNQKIER
ncbi:hypothetical protein, partial [Brucella intermedia]|uniref:hypothetical protein n=1 Tax=Brucella intermedia TaxID=94625 RepID=UPI0023601021